MNVPHDAGNTPLAESPVEAAFDRLLDLLAEILVEDYLAEDGEL